jgi:hypothetical protein
VGELWRLLTNLVGDFLYLAVFLISRALSWSLVIAWFAWWSWGVNWKKTWPVLKGGAWVVVVLAMITGALVWSQIAPSEWTGLEFITIPNFWWQLVAMALLTALTLFCGWLQGVLGWTPAEVELDSPQRFAADHDHGNGHY